MGVWAIDRSKAPLLIKDTGERITQSYPMANDVFAAAGTPVGILNGELVLYTQTSAEDATNPITYLGVTMIGNHEDYKYRNDYNYFSPNSERMTITLEAGGMTIRPKAGEDLQIGDEVIPTEIDLTDDVGRITVMKPTGTAKPVGVVTRDATTNGYPYVSLYSKQSNS